MTLKDGLNNIYEKLQNKAKDLTPVLETIRQIIQEAIDDNFIARGRYNGDSDIGIFSGGSMGWEPLAESTKKAYAKKGWVLEPTLNRGIESGLRNSIGLNIVGGRSIEIVANSLYARIHQLGGGGGLNHSASIPPRPFLTITPEDVQDIIDVMGKYIIN